MQNMLDYINNSLKKLYSEPEIKSFSRIILEEVTDSYFPSITIDKNTKITETQQEKIKEIVDRLKQFEPIQYILEYTVFYGLNFYVNKNVLIPRPETEELVELIINENKNRDSIKILDIGTGSGAIAITLAKYIKSSDVSAWDISFKAIDVAVLNMKRNATNVAFQRIDVLSDYPIDKKYDIIVSNPPYVLESEKKEMENNVLDYEPHLALFVPDNDPLLFYNRIAEIAKNILNKNGKLYFEINASKGHETYQMLKEKGFGEIILTKDISGNDRIVKAEI